MMHILKSSLVFFGFLFPTVEDALAQSSLPACQGNVISNWKKCFTTQLFLNGDKYAGEYKNGNYDGQGTFTTANGEKYVGEFKDSQFNGQGTLVNANGDKYVGEFKNNKYNGQGTLVHANGEKYVGEFKNNKYNGRGTFIFPNGEKYVGDFKDNNRNGKGTNYAANGSINYQGSWLNGKLVQSFSVEIGKSNLDRIETDLAESRKKQKESEQRLIVTQIIKPQDNTPVINIPPERRVALIIGNATYKINPLKNPVNDSNDIASSLRSIGFDVIEVNNATLVQMREATRKFGDKLSNSDVGLVYYSGHGVEVKGKNYLIPVNADIKREYEVVDQAFDASQFLEMMDNIRGPNNKRVNILIVDACRNNELQRSWRSTNNGLARMNAPGGTFISFATAPGSVAADGLGRNSPYTKYLLQALKQPNMPIEQVFKVVRRNVMDETNGEQIPWENSSLIGDFFFTVRR